MYDSKLYYIKNQRKIIPNNDIMDWILYIVVGQYINYLYMNLNVSNSKKCKFCNLFLKLPINLIDQ